MPPPTVDDYHQVYRDSLAQSKVTSITNEWVEQYPDEIVIRSLLVSGDQVKILITGAKQPSSIDDLTTEVRAHVAQVANIDLRFVPSREYRYP